jgi:glycerophosphoryl diester phosphodiesterase
VIADTRIVAGATGYGLWPGNSLEGARGCLAAPVDGVEIDVQMTRDGVVVAHHDYRLSRSQTRLDGEWLSTRGPAIKTLTFAELQRYDVGRVRPGSEAATHASAVQMDGVRVPALRDLLALLNAAEGPRRLLYVEIKTDPQDKDSASDPHAITEAVLDEIETADYAAHTKIIAFDWQVLRLARARHPGIATAHLTIPASLASRVKPLPNGDSPWADDCDPRHHDQSILRAIKAHGGMEWSPYYTEVTQASVAAARALDLKVGPWGLSSSDDIKRMIALGVFSATVAGPDWA